MQLEINRIPQRDLDAALERFGRHRLERELNVHRTTLERWQRGRVKIPGRQHLAIKMLLGDLPGTDGEWTGWGFKDGKLWSPGNEYYSAGDVLSLIFLRQQLTAQRDEILALKARLAIAEAAQPQAANEVRPTARRRA